MNADRALELAMFADRLARELICEASEVGWTMEEAYQVAEMTATLMRRTQPNKVRTVEAMLEARATLLLVSGDLIAQ